MVTDWQLPQTVAAPSRNVRQFDFVTTMPPTGAPGVCVLRLQSRHFSSLSDPELRQLRGAVLDRALSATLPTIALDLTGAWYGAAFLGTAAVLVRQLAAYDRRLCILNDHLGLFALTGMDQLIPCFSDAEGLATEMRAAESR